jgi:hypothetical protein
MPLVRLKDEYLEQDGVRFLMADEIGNTVACREGPFDEHGRILVTSEALARVTRSI